MLTKIRMRRNKYWREQNDLIIIFEGCFRIKNVRKKLESVITDSNSKGYSIMQLYKLWYTIYSFVRPFTEVIFSIIEVECSEFSLYGFRLK